MTITTLDRYVFWRSTKGALALVVLVTLLIAGLDLLLRLAAFTDDPVEGGGNRVALIARYVLYRIPTVVSPLLPLAAVGGALIALVPMLRRGELTALAASGVSLRRSCRGVFALACLLGVADLALSDQVVPRLQGPAARVEAELTGRAEHGRIWRVEDTGATWFASRVWLTGSDSRAIGVAVADGRGRLLTADELAYEPEDGWVLRDALIEDATGVVRTQRLPTAGWLALPVDPAGLAHRLASRHALTGAELWRRDGRMGRALALRRWLRLVVPLLCLACALPMFVRFANRERLITATGQSLAVAALPLGILALGAAATDNGDLPPMLMLGASLVAATLPGAWLVLRWRM